MDIEQLNKSQIILLTLMCSFVTSVATGIATVSLMEQAPADVTRVISRIVEKPIETVVPGPKEIITQEQTVIVSENELIADSVPMITPSIVRIYSLGRNDARTFEGLGIIVSSEGLVAADHRIIRDREQYVARLSNGTELAVETTSGGSEEAFFTLVPEEDTTLPALTVASFEPFSELSLGQTVIAVSGEHSTRIAPGVIAELLPSTAEGSASRVRTTLDTSGVVLGTPLITLEGRVVGMPENIESKIFLSLRENPGT